MCESHNVAMRTHVALTDQILEPQTHSRILIIDQTVASDCLNRAKEICSKATQDIVVFTGDNLSVPHTVQLMKVGAAWVFSKPYERRLWESDFAAVIQSAHDLNQQVEEHCRMQRLMAEISPREMSVLELVLNGVPNKQIAKQLQVSVRTVESRRAKIYKKCEVRTVTELVRRVDHAELLRRRFADCKRNLSVNKRSVSQPDNHMKSA